MNISNSDEDELLAGEPSNSHLLEKLNELINHTKVSANKINDYIQSNDIRSNNIESKVNKQEEKIDVISARVNELFDKSNSIIVSNELLKQNMLKNNLVIVGISANFGDELHQFIFNIAAFVGIKLARNDITNCYRIKNSHSGLIVVRFSNFEVRNQLLYNKQRQIITLGDLFELNNNELATQKVYVNPHVTPYFNKLITKARIEIREKRIHSYFISSQGLMVKVSPDSSCVAIVSLEQFNNIYDSRSDVHVDAVNDLINNISVSTPNEQTIAPLPKINLNQKPKSVTNKGKSGSVKRSKPDSKSPNGSNERQTRQKKHKSSASLNRTLNKSIQNNIVSKLIKK